MFNKIVNINDIITKFAKVVTLFVRAYAQILAKTDHISKSYFKTSNACTQRSWT